MSRAVWCASVLALLAVHCGGSDGGGVPSDAADAGLPGARDGSAGDAGNTFDDPDDEGVDANNDGADGVASRDVYVDAAFGSDTSEGTPKAPLRTLRAAAIAASQRGGRVLAAAGNYAVGDLQVPGVWAIYGGYSKGFKGAPKREITLLSASETGILIDTATDVRLSHLTIFAQGANETRSRSAHALRTKVAKLVLDDVVVQAGDGFAGAAGRQGQAGADGLTASGTLECDGVVQPDYAKGSLGTSYEGNLPGSFPERRRARRGSAGASGTDGFDGAGKLAIYDDLVTGDAGKPGQSDGKPGYGAAGGDTRGFPGYYANFGGSGGCPGKGGTGGESGGASVAMVVLSGAVEVYRSHLRTGLGGDGGDGGDGGLGGHGGLGGAPLSHHDNAPFSPAICRDEFDDPTHANCAAWGGIGGKGGDGGRGGGGAGGATVGILSVREARVTVDTKTVISPGTPGAGGRGNGGGRAPSGKRATTLQLD